MEQYHWPGNIREMENLIERLAVTSEYEMIEIDSLPARMREATRDEPSTLKAAIENLEKDMIIQSLKEQRTTRKAAEKLGISQSSIVKKMNKLNISKGMF
ncbi:helix-turn-helix domain-containing protein [Thalassobacillus sp. C254]|uniref:helix-turn-helix domain-containing protein n=1 Tax=Thalassobacillus sp. C254 TaxID=1225341 RepID=UPI0022B6D2F9|nr:helix-turn-helix domain-containing protein [Thalassobacillus sp. C254]